MTVKLTVDAHGLYSCLQLAGEQRTQEFSGKKTYVT